MHYLDALAKISIETDNVGIFSELVLDFDLIITPHILNLIELNRSINIRYWIQMNRPNLSNDYLRNLTGNNIIFVRDMQQNTSSGQVLSITTISNSTINQNLTRQEIEDREDPLGPNFEIAF